MLGFAAKSSTTPPRPDQSFRPAEKLFLPRRGPMGNNRADSSTQELLLGLQDGKLQVALIVQVSPKALAGLLFEGLQRQTFVRPCIRRILRRERARSGLQVCI